jgi:N-acetyltransferase
MNLDPTTLTGQHVRLEPLALGHLAALCEVGLDPELWRMTTKIIRTPEEMQNYVEEALRLQRGGTALPFAIVDLVSKRVAGSTRFGNIDTANRRVEIGWTWIAPPWQRTVVNSETKYLLLTYAFETLGCIRVEFKTDSLNERSRKALLRIGAREEGTLRNHMIVAGGRIRHSVYYSILDTEWPAVKMKLNGMIIRTR